jgi:hypothetical protein
VDIEFGSSDLEWCRQLVCSLPLTELFSYIPSETINSTGGGTTSGNSRSKRLKRRSGGESVMDAKLSYFVAKKRHHYDGCKMYAPDDRHLCNITARRAEW